MKQRIRLTESDLHRIVKESVKRVLRESAYDINSPEYKHNYDSMRDSVIASDNDIMDMQIAHHNGKKGMAGYNFKGKHAPRDPKKQAPRSIETIVSNVIRALESGKKPSEIPNLKVFSEDQKNYIKNEVLFPSEYLYPIGIVGNDSNMIVYNSKQETFEATDALLDI